MESTCFQRDMTYRERVLTFESWEQIYCIAIKCLFEKNSKVESGRGRGRGRGFSYLSHRDKFTAFNV